MKNKKALAILGSIVIVGILFFVAARMYKGQQAERVGFIAAQDFSVFVRPHSPRLGNENAKVFLVEFLDPECESCRMFYPHVKEVLKEFEDKVQLVVRYAPFHGNSVLVIKILEGARKQNKYWETLSLLFETQPMWGSHHHPKPELIWQLLPNLGLDVEQIRNQLEDPKNLALIEQDKADLIQLGVRGTPTFFVNGKQLQEFSVEALREAVRSEVEATK